MAAVSVSNVTGAAMNERPDQLGRCLDDRLGEMMRQIADARDAFTNAGQQMNWAVEVKLEQARTRAAARSSQFQKERERVNAKVKRELAQAKEKVEEWKNSGQTKKLRQYAAQAEHYALAAILDANDAIDDALIAAMESLAAGAIADGGARTL
jgi:hypothetical protein